MAFQIILALFLVASTEVEGQNIRCKHAGKEYGHGETFISADCTSECTCVTNAWGWNTRCDPLCSYRYVYCGRDERLEYVDEPVGKGTDCKCRTPKCVPVKPIEVACNYKGSTYKIGETFISNDCRGRCTCVQWGSNGWRVNCESLCPRTSVQCAPGEKVNYLDVPAATGSQCSCRKPICEADKKDVQCIFDGNTYKVGETFIPDNCRGKCTCKDDGSVGCISLCPLMNVQCKAGEKLKFKDITVGGSHCKCKIPVCEPAPGCTVDGKTYKVGETFIPDNCRGKCTCQKDGSVGCVSMCPPMQVQCKAGEKLKYKYVTVGDGHCKCKTPVCEQAKEIQCVFDGQTYKVGDSFIPKNCRGRCTCAKDGSDGWRVSCDSLCPPYNVQCKPGERLNYKDILVLGSTHCTCRTPYCEPDSQKTCKYNGNVYKVGEKFQHDDLGKYKCQTCACDEVGDGVYDVTCAQLCPANKIKCKDDERVKYQGKEIGSDGKCSCLIPFCEARPSKQNTDIKGGDRVCSYHIGGAGLNPSNTFCPNKQYWPAPNINTKTECLDLCKSLKDCPQADFYSQSSQKCWVYKEGKCTVTYQPWEDYIRCRAEGKCLEIAMVCRNKNAEQYCQKSLQYRKLCCETCQKFE